jgi:hypothetical protein
MAHNSTPLLQMFTSTTGFLNTGELASIFARTAAPEMARSSLITRFRALSPEQQTTLFNDMSAHLRLGDLAWLLTETCLDPSLSHMPADIWGSDAQIEVLQYIRGCVTNDTWDFVEDADERVNVAVPGTHLFNVIVAMYRKWSRLWKRANPEHSPDSSYASASSSRASSRASSSASSQAPRANPPVHQRPSATPSPRQSPWTHDPSGLSPSPRPRPGGAYRDSASSRHSASAASASPPPHRPSTSHGHQSRPASRSRTPPAGHRAPRPASARSHMDAALLNLKALQL